MERAAGKEDRAPASPAVASGAPAPTATANNSSSLALAAAHILQQAQQQSAASGVVSSPSPQSPAQPTVAQNPAAAQTATAADTLHTLASIMNSSAAVAAAAANKHLLPSSAPVSSLLPPVPGIASTTPASPATTAATAAAAARASSAAQSVASTTSQPSQPSISSHLAALLSRRQSTTPPPASSSAAAHFAATQNPLLRHPSNSAQVAAAAAAASAVPSALSVPNMQNWSLEQLQQHVRLLEQLKQPIPQTVSLLLADAKRKEEKRNAKRIANRKSASTSRARKKAYVQEMTELNARLKRQALILSLLPDMVIVIGLDGNISFCSAQVERVLRYDTEELLGVNLTKLLDPASKDKLNRLIKQLTGSTGSSKRVEGDDKSGEEGERKESQGASSTPGSGSSGALNSGAAAVVSEPSFPLSVVQVEAKREKKKKKGANDAGGSSDQQDTSDTSTSNNGKNLSSLTASNESNENGSDNDKKDVNAEEGSGGERKGGDVGRKSSGQFPSSDVSNSSSLSTNAKNVQQANTNLERNVRIHNKKFKTESLGSLYKDDVTGADVTANNASARLSSLQHRPESSSSEEDSGYRESNDSREETSSSVSDSSGSNGRRRPIAPTCNVCLIRKDSTTIWCEVTSSIRTKEPDEDSTESLSGNDSNKKMRASSGGSKTPPPSSSEQGTDGEPKPKETEVEKELLLCLRPVRDGEKLRFESKKRGKKKRSAPDAAWDAGQAPASPSALASGTVPSRPFKKRGLAEVSSKNTSQGEDPSNKAEAPGGPEEMDTDAAESLMLMTGKKASP